MEKKKNEDQYRWLAPMHHRDNHAPPRWPSVYTDQLLSKGKVCACLRVCMYVKCNVFGTEQMSKWGYSWDWSLRRIKVVWG